MKISEAQSIIDAQHAAGLISSDEARRMSQLIRRTGDYGSRWSWQQQARMRAIVVQGRAD